MAIQSKGHHTEDIIYRFGPPKEMKLTPAYMTPLDMIMPLTYNRHIYFYRNPDPTAVFMPTRALAAGLEKALSYYPVLYSGFITKPDRLREFTTIGYPIPLYERQVNYGFERFEPDWRHDSIPADWTCIGTSRYDEAPMLAARITRFRNNEGVAITIAIHHVVSDGFGVEIFMDTWTACVRGDTPLRPAMNARCIATGMPTEKHPEYYWVKPDLHRSNMRLHHRNQQLMQPVKWHHHP
ncbi:hypothetical protein BDF22DRAFT_733791 [Syncephalis plumigaleata]|nr:hypothetical protein BDF22DRAFT_733791 [Syncephalis plumigaleata]